MSTPVMTYHYYVLLPHASAACLLLFPADGGWRLPYWNTTDLHFWQTVEQVNRAVRRLFAIDAVTLRCLGTAYDPAQMRISRWYELENRGPEGTPSPGQWCGPEAKPDMVDQHERALLAEWFREAAEGIPAQRRPWARRGWWSIATAWIDDQLARQGLRRTGTCDQLRTWERSCVLRVPTTGGPLYFKVLPAMFAHEIPLVEALAMHYPPHIVELLAVDRDRHWLLMADMGSQSLDQIFDLARWEEALRLFARIQITTASMAPEIATLGCPDRPIERLADQIETLFSELPSYPGLSADEIASLHALAPALKQACAALARLPIPIALEHGDFWPSNVLISATDYAYVDWSDSSLAHPFFSLALFLALEGVPPALASVPNLTARLRDAYLEPWTPYAAPDCLLAAFALAQLLAPLHHALTYHLVILPHLEARWELENMVGFYLKMLLRRWSAGTDLPTH